MSSNKDSGSPKTHDVDSHGGAAADKKSGSTPTESGHFSNDPVDSDNPNEAIEKFREKLRPEPM